MKKGRIQKRETDIQREIKRIENENEDIRKYKPLIKLYDRADIINDIA